MVELTKKKDKKNKKKRFQKHKWDYFKRKKQTLATKVNITKALKKNF